MDAKTPRPLAHLALLTVLIPFREAATAWSRWQENQIRTRRLLVTR